MRLASSVVALLLLTLSADVASAQLAVTWPGGYTGSSRWSRGYSRGYYSPAISPFAYSFYGPYYYGYSYGPYDTIDPYGYADVLRAQGEYNRNTAEAQIQGEAARKQNIENNVKATEAYFARQEMGQQAQAKKFAGLKETRDRWLKNREPETPNRPTILQFDQKTGKIYWPEVLQLGEYAAWRERLDLLFADRSQRTAETRHSLEIRQTAKELLQELKFDIRRLPTTDYIEAKKFVESLAWEAQFAAGE